MKITEIISAQISAVVSSKSLDWKVKCVNEVFVLRISLKASQPLVVKWLSDKFYKKKLLFYILKTIIKINLNKIFILNQIWNNFL